MSGEREITLRGVLLGVAMTFVFTAANVYLGLRVGLTFATSIPAAVISMALLRFVRGAGILENNIVQTVASAAGALASVIFVLPALVMVGWWTHFPFWQSFAACAAGGLLGVMFSIPLRRALVTGSDLPYPEGVAAAEVLKIGVGTSDGDEENRRGLRLVIAGSLASAGFALLGAMRLAALEVTRYVRVGGAVTGIEFGASLALVGAGHLVGLSVGMALLAGAVIAWGVAVPVLSLVAGHAGPAAEVAPAIWREQVRFIGAGVIGVAAIWTLGRLLAPIARGLTSAVASSRARSAEGRPAVQIEERDIPIVFVAWLTLALLVPLALVLASFVGGSALAPLAPPLVAGGLIYILVVGAFVASVCGYMAGLMGSSNSPVSGIGILAVIGISLLLGLFAMPVLAPGAAPSLIAYALFVTAVVISASVVANDNLQDLKTGQLLGATPWRQQVALMIGTVAGAAVIPPVLDLLNAAYGFAGTARAASSGAASVLPAPQATLIAALAKGVLGGGLDWSLIATGAGVGAVLILVDGVQGRTGRMRLPPLGVGIGIYLPMSASAAVVLGAVLGHLFDRRAARSPYPEARRRMGVLIASGMIVGESLFGVLLAAIIVASGRGEPLALVGDGFAGFAVAISAAVFVALLVWLYRRAGRAAG